ncbi:uncharacterized protein LOC135844566 isoform X2 [Planococcus citri]|uniref:uncharacterized protein LOC135844566 isoform X2 n=1 Tax=Planococcus citri TaxID=170843 RepID=UPI0031F8E92C
MVPLILLLTAVIFQVTTNWIVLSDEVPRNAYNDEYYDVARLAKRYLGALAKNKQLPTSLSVQERSLPPMVSPYAQKAYSYPGPDEPEIVESKRYLGSLARSGDLNFSKPQQKKNTGELESEEPADEYIQNKGYTDELPNFMIMKLELIDSLKPVILEYIEQQKKEYDPKKVNLFLENLANAVFDRNEEFSLENIKTLVKSDYFQPEENEDMASAAAAAAVAAAKKELQKRNIQSLVRDFNVSFGGSHRRASRNFRDSQIDFIKRNLESVIKNKMYKRYVGAMAKNDAFPHQQPGKRYYNGFGSDLEEYLKTLQAKRHTMYDINEPDLTVEYPSQAAEQNDYTDYAEQMGQDAAIPIGKRYIGPHHAGWAIPEMRKPSIGRHRKL